VAQVRLHDAARSPSGSGHGEGRFWEDFATVLAQPGPVERAERGHVGACRANAELERLPPVVEGRMINVDGEHRVLDRAQTSFSHQLG
jgi:hypothetical protein